MTETAQAQRATIKRETCTIGSPLGWAAMMAGCYWEAPDWREILVSHDGSIDDTPVRQCKFSKLAEELELMAQGKKRIAVVIDNQPTFFEGRKLSPVKAEVVSQAIEDALAHGGDKLAMVYVVE